MQWRCTINNSAFANIKLECYRLKRNLSNDVITTLISHIVIDISAFYKINFNASMVVHDGKNFHLKSWNNTVCFSKFDSII